MELAANRITARHMLDDLRETIYDRHSRDKIYQNYYPWKILDGFDTNRSDDEI